MAFLARAAHLTGATILFFDKLHTWTFHLFDGSSRSTSLSVVVWTHLHRSYSSGDWTSLESSSSLDCTECKGILSENIFCFWTFSHNFFEAFFFTWEPSSRLHWSNISSRSFKGTRGMFLFLNFLLFVSSPYYYSFWLFILIHFSLVCFFSLLLVFVFYSAFVFFVEFSSFFRFSCSLLSAPLSVLMSLSF